MSQITNVHDIDNEIIGSVCYKPQGHWTAYLATPAGDKVIGQHPTKGEAIEAVEQADVARAAECAMDALAAVGIGVWGKLWEIWVISGERWGQS